MLVQFKVKNFRSIRSEACLDLSLNPSVKEFEENTITNYADKYGKYCKSIVIYGVNGAGKSNLFDAIEHMRRMILLGHRKTIGDKLSYDPFLLNETEKSYPTSYYIEFIVNDTFYEYGFSYNRTRIISEFLNAYPKQVKQEWFWREYNYDTEAYDWKFGANFKGEKESIRLRTLENTLFLSKAAHENHELIFPLIRMFSRGLSISNDLRIKTGRLTLDMLSKEESRKLVVDFLKSADLGLDDLIIEEVESDQRYIERLDYDSDQFYRRPRQIKRPKSIHLTTDYNVPVEFDFRTRESQGTNKLFNLAGVIFKTLQYGGVLIIDEIETNLHCKIIDYIIDIFHNKNTNPNNSQLIFTTHNPVLLETTNFRRDQIYFVSKDDSKSTLVYNLSRLAKYKEEFKPVRKGQNLLKGYLDGKFYDPPKPDREALVSAIRSRRFPQMDLFDDYDANP